MCYSHLLVILSALITIWGSSAYIHDTLRGKTRPNRVSWGLWAFAPLLGTAAALYADANIWATIRIFLAGFLPLIVFIASFIDRKSYWKLTPFDLLCGFCSIAAIIVWAVLESPRMAILFAAIGDGFASIPTLIKTWKFPETETGITYLAGLISVLLILPSIPTWNIENSAFQIYLLLITTALVIAVYRKKIPFKN